MAVCSGLSVPINKDVAQYHHFLSVFVRSQSTRQHNMKDLMRGEKVVVSVLFPLTIFTYQTVRKHIWLNEFKTEKMSWVQ